MRHQESLYEEAHRYVYTRPIEKVWPEVVRLVTTEGYAHRKGDDEFLLITEWRSDTQESRVVSSSSRLYVEAYRVDRNTSAVRIFKQTLFTGNKGNMSARDNLTGDLTIGAAGDVNPFLEDPIKLSHLLNSSADHTPLTRAPTQMSRSFSRDGSLEWKLIQRVDATAAQTIEARVAALESR